MRFPSLISSDRGCQQRIKSIGREKQKEKEKEKEHTLIKVDIQKSLIW